MVKRIIPLILVSSILFSCIVPASATDTPTTGEVVNDIVQASMAEVIFDIAVTAGTTAVGAYFGQPQVGAYLGPVVASGILNYADYLAAGYTDQDIYDQFTNYNAQLEADLGAATLIDGGVRVPFTLNLSTFSGGNVYLENAVLTGSTTVNYSGLAWNESGQTQVQFYTFSAPFACEAVTGCIVSLSSNMNMAFTPVTNVFSEGAVVDFRLNGLNTPLYLRPNANSYPAEVRYIASYYVDLVPVSDSLPTSLDITPISRPTTLTSPVAIQNSDQTYTVYNNITLVDEGNKVVFDPTTGESITFTDWAYDYESRTYDLTLDGGGNMTVQFGNDSITMTQGDTVTNIFYVQDPADDPGTDPDNPGTDADVSGFFAWWKDAWNGFVDRLFTVLNGGDLEVILPGEEGNPEDEEDDGWNVFDLFALIRDALWEIITGVIRTALDGFLGLVQAIAGLGDFFTVFDRDTEGGVLDILNQGGSAVWE